MNKFERGIKVAEKCGWNVEIVDDGVYLQQYTPEGQDFNIYIRADNENDFIKEIQDKYEEFDVSYETYLWLDSDGHGKNGAPYDMRDLYNDMEYCEKELKRLWQRLLVMVG